MKISNGLLGFTGRMERSAYRPRFLVMMVVNLLSGAFLKMPGGAGHRVLGIVFLVSLILIISMMIRRFRDVKSSPWWILPSVIVFGIFYIVGIVLCFKKSKYDLQGGERWDTQ